MNESEKQRKRRPKESGGSGASAHGPMRPRSLYAARNAGRCAHAHARGAVRGPSRRFRSVRYLNFPPRRCSRWGGVRAEGDADGQCRTSPTLALGWDRDSANLKLDGWGHGDQWRLAKRAMAFIFD